MTKTYKVLDENGEVLCEECKREDLAQLLGPRILELKSDGNESHSVHEFTTWNERTARLFAADCAEHVLPFFETRCPDDTRPREAIEVARRIARGEEEPDAALLRSTINGIVEEIWNSWPAAFAARAAREAVDITGHSAGGAKWAAINARAAAGTTKDTSDNARKIAAVARDTEQAWQAERLFDYLEGRRGETMDEERFNDPTEISCFFTCDDCKKPVCRITKCNNILILQQIDFPIYCTTAHGELTKLNQAVAPVYAAHASFCHPLAK